MPPSPDERVILRDSKAELWTAVRDGLVWSSDVSPENGKLRRSLAPTPAASWRTDANKLQSETPFGRQTRPCLPREPPEPPNTPPSSSTATVARAPLRDVTSNVSIDVLRAEMRADDQKRVAVEMAVRKILEGASELERLVSGRP